MGIELAEFLAEEEQIEIVCNRNIPEIRLLTGLIGPFRPLQRQTVPLVSCQEYIAYVIDYDCKCHLFPKRLPLIPLFY